MINKHCLDAFNKLDKPVYHPQEYFMLGWNAAIDAMSAEFSRKWEMDELSDIPLITQPVNEPIEERE
jgi:hypothetical protein